MQVEPNVSLPLVYQITDPSDSTVYYIRAVIKDSLTGNTLDTKNLVSAGSGRYTSSFYAPADLSGSGRHIDVTITVYTNSGYTTVSDIYQKHIDKYLIKRPSLGSTGGGGYEVDYSKITKIVNESVNSKIEDLKKIKDENLPLIIEKIDSLEKIVSTPELPKEDKPIDFTPVLAYIDLAIKSISDKVDNKEVTKSTDLSPVLDSISSIMNAISDLKNFIDILNSKNSTANQTKEVKDIIETSISTAIENALKSINEKYNKINEAKSIIDSIAGSGYAPTPDTGPDKMISKYIQK